MIKGLKSNAKTFRTTTDYFMSGVRHCLVEKFMGYSQKIPVYLLISRTSGSRGGGGGGGGWGGCHGVRTPPRKIT